MSRNATRRNAITMPPACMGRSGIHLTREHLGSKKALRSCGRRSSWQTKGAMFPWCQKVGSPSAQRLGRGERGEKLVRARQLMRNHEPVLALPQDPWLGRRRTEFIPILPADQCARSNGTNGTEKRRLPLSSTIPELQDPRGWRRSRRRRPRRTGFGPGFPTVSPSHPSVFPHHGIQGGAQRTSKE